MPSLHRCCDRFDVRSEAKALKAVELYKVEFVVSIRPKSAQQQTDAKTNDGQNPFVELPKNEGYDERYKGNYPTFQVKVSGAQALLIAHFATTSLVVRLEARPMFFEKQTAAKSAKRNLLYASATGDEASFKKHVLRKGRLLVLATSPMSFLIKNYFKRKP